jgi:cytochrome o ubiquinol oxidase operon protein cyoD
MNKSPLLKFVSLETYIIGFSFSLVLTLISFGLVQLHLFLGRSLITHPFIIPAILIFAIVQLLIQVIFFLHLLREDRERWNLMFFVSTIGLIIMIVIASIWILDNLNYNMMPEQQVQHVLMDEGIKVDKRH